MSVESTFVDTVFYPTVMTAKYLYLLTMQAKIEWGDRGLAASIPNDSTVIVSEKLTITGAQLHAIIGVVATIVDQIDANDGAIRKLLASVGEPISMGR